MINEICTTASRTYNEIHSIGIQLNNLNPACIRQSIDGARPRWPKLKAHSYLCAYQLPLPMIENFAHPIPIKHLLLEQGRRQPIKPLSVVIEYLGRPP